MHMCSSFHLEQFQWPAALLAMDDAHQCSLVHSWRGWGVLIMQTKELWGGNYTFTLAPVSAGITVGLHTKNLAIIDTQITPCHSYCWKLHIHCLAHAEFLILPFSKPNITWLDLTALWFFEPHLQLSLCWSAFLCPGLSVTMHLSHQHSEVMTVYKNMLHFQTSQCSHPVKFSVFHCAKGSVIMLTTSSK